MQDGSTGACLACPLSSVTAGSKCALPAARRHEARLTAPRHESQGRGAWGVEEEGFGWATVFIHVRQLPHGAELATGFDFGCRLKSRVSVVESKEEVPSDLLPG